VTSPDEALLAHIDATYGDRVLCVRRDRKLARLNVYVHDALLGAAEAYAENHPTPDVLAVLMIESPFRTADYIDSAVNAIEVFQTDAVVTVRPERDVFYRHNGAGMETVSKGQNLRLEGEDLFREAGQLRVVKFDCLREGKEPDQIRLGHVVVDQRAALVIQSEWDWRIAEFEAQQGVESGRGGAE
jgi:CMP-N-acetylneuraminic acid synthetase